MPSPLLSLKQLRGGLRLGMLPWVVLVTGLGLTGLWCHQERSYKKLEHERTERDLAQEISGAILSRLQTNIAILDAVSGLFDASSDVTKDEFHSFYEAISEHGETLKGIQGLGYAAVVPNGDISAFEQQVHRRGQPDFKVKPAGSRPLTTAILYLEPTDWRNQRAVGYDMYSQVTRRDAMQLAAETGQPALSGPVRLLQENQVKPQVGALIYQAIYRNPDVSFGSSADRLSRVRGWAYSPLRMEDLIQGSLGTIKNPALNGTAVLVYDSSRSDPKNLLFDNFELANSKELNHPTWSEVVVANRTWVIGIQLDHRNLSPGGWSQTLLLQALVGMSLSSLAAVISQRLLSSHLALRQLLEREQEASKEQALAGTVFESSPTGIVVTDADGLIIRVNTAFSQLSGYSELEAIGQKPNLLKSDRHESSFYEQMWKAIMQRGYWNGEIWNRHRSGQVIRHELSITAVFDQQRRITNFVGLLRDISERYSQQEQMRFMATHDQLTGLANRSLLIEELNLSLALAKRQNLGVGLLFIDLDNFKPVNDLYGHGTGDQLLQVVAQRLSACVRKSDTLCRQGGDEFVLLVPNAPKLEQLLMIANNLNQAIQQPFNNHPQIPSTINLSASIGVARWPDHANDADSLIEAADTAMYRAKQVDGKRIAVAEAKASA